MKPSWGAVVYSTPWFDLVAKRVEQEPEPYYALRTVDYVCVVALTPAGEVVLVRQFRPAVEARTLELPAGHVEANQTPEEAARSELVDETGFAAPRVDLLGSFFSDTGRNENRTWCFLAADVRAAPEGTPREAGIEVVLAPAADLRRLVLEGELNHGPHVAAVMLAALHDGPVRDAMFPRGGASRSSASAAER
jgi:ADP-ribose pyrophosphatase